MKRRETLRAFARTASGLAFSPLLMGTKEKETDGQFRYCLNTSTISGRNPGLNRSIEIAARAGYDGIELWVQEVKELRTGSGSMTALKKLLADSHLVIEDAIGFAPWMVEDEQQRSEGFRQMREEMELMAELGCRRIAAPSAGVSPAQPLDLVKVGDRYHQLLELGRKTGVTPQLEFWGSSPVFYSFGQAFMAAAAAHDPDVHILPDVYHLYRGGSGFDCLGMVSGSLIDVIHINDYPGSIIRTALTDADRVYPGDGIAPYHQIINSLASMGGTKVLSLELFNRTYWKEDPLAVAVTGLEKMKKVVVDALSAQRK